MPSNVFLKKGAKGDLVRKLQLKLALKADGDFGNMTLGAVKSWQIAKKLEPTGEVDAHTWAGICELPNPSLFERCLMLTQNIEGHGYNLAAGNYDGAGITWGIIGFTIKSGSLYKVLSRIPLQELEQIFGKSETAALLTACRTNDINFGQKLSIMSGKKLQEKWQTAFDKLGNLESARKAQRDVVEESYWIPSQKQLEKELPELKSERAAAIAFDSWVQQGKIYNTAIAKARECIKQNLPELKSLEAIAAGQRDGMSLQARTKWGNNVFARRITIARGAGIANGVNYDLSNYGLNLVPR